MKIYNKFIHTDDQLRLYITSIENSEFYSIEKDDIESDLSRTLYQYKFGSLLFAVIATRPNIAFAVSCFSKFDKQLLSQYHEVVDWIFYYLFLKQNYCIRYRRETQTYHYLFILLMLSFCDNTLDQKSFHRYIIKLFGRAIASRTNKLDMVTTSLKKRTC